MQLDHQKNTFCVAVGEPDKIHYAIDLSTGAIVKIWKGDFLDVTTMWTGRGQQQLAKPLGNKLLTLKSISPFLFSDKIVQQEDGDEMIKFKGYSLSKEGSPVFKYLVDGTEVSDRIWSVPEDTQRLNRQIQIGSNSRPVGARIRLAHGASIQRIKKNVYSVDGRSYTITINSKLTSEPLIVKTGEGTDLLVPWASVKNNEAIDYSIVW